MNEPQYNPKLTGIQNFKIAFEKGKLEERERISFEVKRLIIDIKKHWDKVVNPKENVLRGLKQLQKEIGDDSQQPRMKQTRGGELKSDEGLHSTDNGSPADIVSKGFLDGYAEFWDNPEDDRWDKEYNPDLLPETLKNKEEKQDE